LKIKGEYSVVILRVLFALMVLLVVSFFWIGETVMPGENPTQRGACDLYVANWERVLPDGSRKTVEIPGQCDAKRNEVVRLETILSQNQEDTWFCMRASQQDMRVYVGDELRKEYTTEDTRVFGRNSASAYVFFAVSEKDAGKVLAIELVSDSEYSGFLNKVYVGEKADIVDELIRQCLLVIVVSLYMLILSSIIVIAGGILDFVFKKRMDIIYMGIGRLLLS